MIITKDKVYLERNFVIRDVKYDTSLGLQGLDWHLESVPDDYDPENDFKIDEAIWESLRDEIAESMDMCRKTNVHNMIMEMCSDFVVDACKVRDGKMLIDDLIGKWSS